MKEQLEQEYLDFINDLKSLSAEEIIDKAYEKVIKEEIKDFIVGCDYCFSEETLETYNAEGNFLEYLYNDWLSSSFNPSEVLDEWLGTL